MITLVIPWAALAPYLIGAGGSILGRAQSQGDIARQNAYNHPLNQVRRLTEAGLPMAAMTSQGVGNQSALPITSGGEAGGRLSQYITSQTQLQQLELVKEEIRLKQAEADKFGAERDWYLSQHGNGKTNLVNTLQSRLGLDQAHLLGQNITNKINEHNLNNTPYQIQLNNLKTGAEIGNLLKQNNLIDEQIEGEEIKNRIQKVIADYQPGMSLQHLNKLLKEVGLITESVTGKKLDNALQRIQNRIEASTEVSQITSGNLAGLMSQLSYDKIGEEFENYKQYQEFVQLVQDRLNDKKWRPGQDIKALIALAYTTVVGISGNSPGASGILGGVGETLKPSPKTFKTYHFHND